VRGVRTANKKAGALIAAVLEIVRTANRDIAAHGALLSEINSQQRNIAHMAVLRHSQKHAILQLIFCWLLLNTERKAVLSSPALST
jgi:hypothetical protein